MPDITVPVEEFANGVSLGTSQRVVSVTQDLLNEQDIRSKAQQALTNNATFLAIATPTAGQNAAQAKALTRQMNGVIRLLLGALDNVGDT